MTPVNIDGFIRTNRPKWDRLEALLRGRLRSGDEVDELVSLYLLTSTHLSEVRGRSRSHDLERFLNDLVTRAHGRVYAAAPDEDRPRFLEVFVGRYRLAIRETLPYILVAVALLLVVATASWVWVALSPAARAGVVSPEVARAIGEAGGGRDPSFWPPGGITTFISLNNIQVAFLAYGLGITFGVGTVWVVVQNAVMLGELAGAFAAAGKGSEFWSLILPHGLLELLAICIAAGAGLRIGWALIAPGDRSRSQALQDAARGSVAVIIGVIPAFLLAGFIEGFITGTGVPDAVEMAIGILAFVGYAILVFTPARRPRDTVPVPPAVTEFRRDARDVPRS